ncbi:GNAT family N-acetyltransferase, putative [Talaromyces stipitatus ATCC 10500]|uniref:GNAT family N-acetyltransferase, putative n=1 Tax=Talaromyces stipitatus (strain ATCC 10500 / CBS 375.48 / QM 6759 / NRRL 1006) TaxID=441959 RepID=B8MP51_TALSN|nr:GNAT family N-acetyltransferase, putative [Talaromyces stipitatus ATCC 10500]EED14290.1 GNAT family N-acetyltransferase, putative [Talaromyces stipitatus ATCC 10500]
MIRNATPADLPQIRAINTHYILNTVLTFMQTPPPPGAILTKYNEIKTHGLPYFVAVDDELKYEDSSGLILGYAYLSPYRGHMLSYASTVELTLFVHPEHQSKAVGSKLLAAILKAAESGFLYHCHVYESTGSDEDQRTVFAGDNEMGVPVRNILAVMAVDPNGPDGGDALRRWYITRGFVERGRLEKIGFKNGLCMRLNQRINNRNPNPNPNPMNWHHEDWASMRFLVGAHNASGWLRSNVLLTLFLSKD